MASDTKFVLITGANTGVGYAAAKLILMACPSYHVLLGSRDSAKGAAAAQDLQSLESTQGKVTAVQIDVTSGSSIEATASYVKTTFGRLDSLVNNAGICDGPPDGNVTSPSLLRTILETNLIGACATTEAFLPLLDLSSDPRLVFVTTSLASFIMGSDPSLHQYRAAVEKMQFSEYRISKAALNMAMLEYMKALQLKAEKGQSATVRVWGVDPGVNKSGLILHLMDESRKAQWQALPDPEQAGGKVLSDVVLGKRDGEEGKVIWAEGVRPW